MSTVEAILLIIALIIVSYIVYHEFTKSESTRETDTDENGYSIDTEEVKDTDLKSQTESTNKDKGMWWESTLGLVFIGGIIGGAMKASRHRITTEDIIIFSLVFGGIGIYLIYYVVKKYKVIEKITNSKSAPNPDELLKWYELKEKGVISEEEFEKHKKRIMKE